MSPTCIEPELETPVEEIVEETEERIPSPELPPDEIGWKQRIRNLLVTIFEGHEEFLGWTPD